MTRPAARRSPLLFTVVLIFALVSVLWFGLSFAVSAQLIADGSMRDRIHLVFGYAAATEGSPVNGPVQIMCGATAAAQVTTALAMAALMRGWLWDEPTDFLLGYAAVAALLAVLIDRSRKRVPAGGG